MWTWILVGIGAAALIAGVSIGVWAAARARRRRIVLGLMVQSEAVDAAQQALVETAKRLIEAGDEELATFATDPQSIGRRTLAEVASRGDLLAHELDHMAVPRRFEPVAQALGDAAFLIGQEAGKVADDVLGEDALDMMASMDLPRVDSYVKKARSMVLDACDACGLEDTAVYGGGLYL